MFIRKTFLITSFLLLGNSYIPVAHAADAKIYPGTMCVRWSGTTNYGLSHSAIVNKSSTINLRVDCPIVRDHTDRSIRSGWVSADSSVRCVLAYRYRNSTNAIRGGDRRHHQVSFRPTVFHYRSLGSSRNHTAHYYYSCTIPPKKRLTAYQVRENT